MKNIKPIRGHRRLAVILCLVAGRLVQAGFVSETDTEFITTADLDGDGRKDIVVADKTSGTFRAGYQLSDDTFTWSDSRGLGATNITGLTSGPLLTNGIDAVAAASLNLNRINVLSAETPDASVFPQAVFGSQYGHYAPVAIDIGGTSSLDDLVVATAQSTPSPYRIELIRSSSGSFSSLSVSTISGLWNRGNNMVYSGTDRCAAFMDRVVKQLRLYEFSSGTIQHIDSLDVSAMSYADYCTAYPNPGGYVHFFLWDAGSSNAYRTALTTGDQFVALSAFSFGAPIERIQAVSTAGATRLIVLFTDGSASVYTYDGSSDPVFEQALGTPPAGVIFSGIVVTAADRFALLTADADTGQTDGMEIYEHDGSSFTGQGFQTLPPVSPRRGIGNVMTFEREPLVDPNPGRLQVLNAGDWTDAIALLSGPSRIEVEYETDLGLPDGLGNIDSAIVGPAHPDANFSLANQAGTAFSVYNVSPALGDQGLQAFVSPDPGQYGAGVSVSFSSSAGTVRYFAADSATWTVFSTPIPVFKDTTFYYFAEDGGIRSPIRLASFTFTDSPGDLDSDGDGVPDYVELAYGLDPVNSGSDSDGDGLQDLEELIAGTDPTDDDSDGDGVSDLNERAAGTDPNDPGDVPPLPITGTPERIDRSTAFDLVITPRPYDGTQDVVTLSETGTAVRAYGAAGWQVAFDTTALNGLSGADDPSAKLEDIPIGMQPRLCMVLTDQHFPVSTTFSNEMIGVELAGVFIPPTNAPPEINYTYSGGVQSVEASNWVSSAQAAYAAATTPQLIGDLHTNSVLATMLLERKLVDELYLRGVYTNRQVTLLGARPADAALQSVTPADILLLQNSTNTAGAFLPGTLVSNINSALETPSTELLRDLTKELYDIRSERGTVEPGAYPLPITELRRFLLSGTLSSNYAAQITLSGNDITNAFDAATNLVSTLAPRSSEMLTLEVHTNSFEQVCPVLYTLSGDPKSLYDSGGRPYVMPFSFSLKPGTQVNATAFTDVSWNRCPGTDPLEIIALDLTAVPTASDADEDGNLLPDAFEQNLLGSNGGAAYSDSDGDGYSDLQEYLEQTDPADALDAPAVPVEDLSPPEITITSINAAEVQLDVNWPAAYADEFVFTIRATDDLVGSGLATDQEFAYGDLSARLNIGTEDVQFFDISIRLR